MSKHPPSVNVALRRTPRSSFQIARGTANDLAELLLQADYERLDTHQGEAHRLGRLRKTNPFEKFPDLALILIYGSGRVVVGGRSAKHAADLLATLVAQPPGEQFDLFAVESHIAEALGLGREVLL
jgi:hypothetical protein